MSKASKSRRVAERLKEKKSRKAQNIARYAGMMAAGKNKKSKRVQLRGKRAKTIRTKRDKMHLPLTLARQVEVERIEYEIAQARIVNRAAKTLAEKQRRAKKATKLAKHMACLAARSAREALLLSGN